MKKLKFGDTNTADRILACPDSGMSVRGWILYRDC